MIIFSFSVMCSPLATQSVAGHRLSVSQHSRRACARVRAESGAEPTGVLNLPLSVCAPYRGLGKLSMIQHGLHSVQRTQVMKEKKKIV